jgi:hypothetical protein
LCWPPAQPRRRRGRLIGTLGAHGPNGLLASAGRRPGAAAQRWLASRLRVRLGAWLSMVGYPDFDLVARPALRLLRVR